MIPIKGLQKTTLVDFPGKVACTVFVGGCNFRCGYCYNADIVLNSLPTISAKEFFLFLSKKKEYLDGVCITGGEPTLYKDLPNFCKKIKAIGYLVKLDTNGTNPTFLKTLIQQNLVDYIAMDIKASPESYEKVVRAKVNIKNIRKSIELIKNSGIDYEFRTTVIPDVINKKEIKKIAKLLKGAKQYFLQQFKPDPKTIDAKYNNKKPLTQEKLDSFKKLLAPYITKVKIRS